MSTATEVDTSDLTEFEFARPCQFRHPCDLEAVALFTKSHTLEGCWGPALTVCQKHLVGILRHYDDWLAKGGTCSVCLGPVSGSLSTNVRIVRL